MNHTTLKHVISLKEQRQDSIAALIDTAMKECRCVQFTWIEISPDFRSLRKPLESKVVSFAISC